jgi:hypothetical protein
MDASAVDGREEIAQVEAEHERLARMESGVGEGGETASKTVSRRMRSNQVEEIVQQTALKKPEPGPGDFQKAPRSPAFGLPGVGVVAQRAGL